MEDIAMKSEYLTAIAIAPFAATVGLAVYVVSSSEPYFCPQPSAASVTSLFAPCQTFDTAMGHAVTKREAGPAETRGATGIAGHPIGGSLGLAAS